MTKQGSDGPETGPEEVAAYIAVLTAEMVRLARSHNMAPLAYLLDLARMEAVEQAGNESKRIA